MRKCSTCKTKTIIAIILSCLLVFALIDMAKLYSFAEETQQTEGENTSGETSGEGSSEGEASGESTEGSGEESTEGGSENGENSEESGEEEIQRETFIRPEWSNEENIYHYLVDEMELNIAAACGVLANIRAESGFRPEALGDKVGDTYTSFGICQWHNNRWNTLNAYCAAMHLEPETLEGQILYLRYELEHNYRHVLTALRKVSNTPDGAYDAGYVFCYRFEIPANKEAKSDYRGRLAGETFWPKYGGYRTESGEEYIWKFTGGKSYWYENGERQGTVNDAKGVLGDGTVRGREIYDPISNGWYWLDAIYDGAKAVDKEVWIPYVYNGEEGYSEEFIDGVALESGTMAQQVAKAIRDHGSEGSGKWVRYDHDGKMIKGWYTVKGTDCEIYPDQIGNTYYYDPQTGLMARGNVNIDGRTYYFNEFTGVLVG